MTVFVGFHHPVCYFLCWLPSFWAIQLYSTNNTRTINIPICSLYRQG